MHETLRNQEKHIEDSEGLRKLLMLVGLNHIAEVLQKLPQTTYESITSVVRSALDRLSPKYQQIAWSLVLATALTACAGIEDASAQTKDNTIDPPGKPTLLTPIPTPTATREITTSPTRQVRPTATATSRPTNTPRATEAPKPIETPMRKQVVEVPAGVNVRQDHSTTAAIEFTSQGVTLEATGEKFDDGTYTWYEVINPEEPPKTVWVANVNGVTLKEVIVTSGTGGPVEADQETANPEVSETTDVTVMQEEVTDGTGGPDQADNQSPTYEEDLLEATRILGIEVDRIEYNGPTKVAKNQNGVIIATYTNSSWKLVELPTSQPTITPETETNSENNATKDYLFTRVPENLKSMVSLLEFNNEIGAWELGDGKFYIPLDTTIKNEKPTIEDGTIDPNEGFVLTNPDTGMRVYVNHAPGAVAASHEWKGDLAKLKKLTTIVQNYLQLPNNSSVEVFLLKDVTNQNPSHVNPGGLNFFEPGGRKDISYKVVQIDDELSGQVMRWEDKDGKVHVRVYISMTDKVFVQTPPEKVGSTSSFYTLNDGLIIAHAALYSAGGWKEYFNGPLGKDLGAQIVTLYDRPAEGVVVSPFGGTAATR